MEKKELPEGWELKKLEDIVDNFDNKRIPLKEDDRNKRRGKYPYCGANGIIDYIDDFIFDGEFLLLAEDGGFWGKGEQSAYIMNGKFWVNNHAHVLKSDVNLVNTKFLMHFLNHQNLYGYISGTTRGKLTQGMMKNIQIILPPLPVQRRIVEILEQADALQRLRTQADAETQKLLQSVFYDMFGDPVRNEKGWGVIRMGELGDWTSGGTPSRRHPEYFEGDIAWYTAGELNDSYLFDSLEHISQEGLDSSAAKIFPTGTILIGMYDSAAFKMGILNRPSASNQACAAFYPKKDLIDIRFALQLFKEMKSSFLSKRRGVRQKNLTQQMIKEFMIPIPPLAIQKQFSLVSERVYEIRKNQMGSKNSIENLFDAVITKAFTGELVA